LLQGQRGKVENRADRLPIQKIKELVVYLYAHEGIRGQFDQPKQL